MKGKNTYSWENEAVHGDFLRKLVRKCEFHKEMYGTQSIKAILTEAPLAYTPAVTKQNEQVQNKDKQNIATLNLTKNRPYS